MIPALSEEQPANERARAALDPTVYNAEERAAILEKMSAVATAFYYLSVRQQCHALIEFTGLINEFILLCQDAHKLGVDFTMANTHGGRTLPMEERHAAYLGEKLKCIYGPSLKRDPAVVRALLGELLGKSWLRGPAAEPPPAPPPASSAARARVLRDRRPERRIGTRRSRAGALESGSVPVPVPHGLRRATPGPAPEGPAQRCAGPFFLRTGPSVA